MSRRAPSFAAVAAILKRVDRAEALLAAAAARESELVKERDELILELADVRKRWMQTIEERNCARDIAEGFAEENDAYKAELNMLRGEPETDLEMAN